MTNLAEARRTKTRRLKRVIRESSDYHPFTGGLNQLDSPLSVEPGQCQNALNYEMGIAGGYRRIGGYLSYDGVPTVATYSLLAYGAEERISRLLNDTIDGDSSGAAGQYLTHTEAGGYGINVLESNQALDTADWAINGTSVSFVDADFVWPSSVRAVQPNVLTKITEEVDVSILQHWFIGANDNIAQAVGDMLYVSGYVRAGTREGIRIGIHNSAAYADNSFQTIQVNASRGTVITVSGSVLASGMELISDGVYLVWMLLPQADVAEAGATISVMLSKETGESTMTTTYIGDGSYIHAGGFMAVVVPFEGPHNLFNGRVYGGNTYWSNTANGLVITDADLAWTSGVYPDFSKIAETVDGSDRTHFMRTTTSSGPSGTDGLVPMHVKAGDKLWGELYVQYTSGQREGIFVTPDMATGFASHPQFWFDAENGQLDILAPGQGKTFGIETFQVTDLGGDIYRIQWTTQESTSDSDFGWSVYLYETGPNPTIVYTGTGKYIHVTGFRAQSFPISVANPGATIRLGYIQNGASGHNAVHTGDLVLSAITGTPFINDEDLSFSTSVFAQAIGIEASEAEPDATLDAEYLALAQQILMPGTPPPGVGVIRGVWMYNGTVYCFKDNSGLTACIMFKATGTGWEEIILNHRLSFDAGTAATVPVAGDTLDGLGSGADAIIRRVVRTSGTWGVDAVGYFILDTVNNGPFDNDETLQVSASTVALADGINAIQTLPVGGRYEFRSNNFYGASEFYRMYGVNGVGLGFEFDDDAVTGFFCEIETGMVVDTPIHLATHNGHLFYGFPGGSVQLSGDGDPVSWTVITGATEIGVGDEITGFNEEVGNSLFIYTRNTTSVLQGNTRANFDLDDFNVNSGAHEWSLQRIGLGTFFDDRGFTTILQTQRTGSTNFQENTVSKLIQPMVKDLATNQQVRCSHLIRTENIYRCYFDDGRVVSIGFDGHKVSGHMPLQYPFIANCAVSEENASGAEEIYIGAEDGSVYRMESGTSFDGADIRSFIRPVLYHSNSPGQFKKYMQARLDATLSGALTLKGNFEYDFHNDEFNLGDELDFSTDEAGGYWDDFHFDAFVWDQPTSGIPQVKLEGEGVNIAAYLYSTSKIDKPHTLRGLMLQWQPRRDDRRN